MRHGGSGRGPTEGRGGRRRLILEAAVRLFGAKGFHRTTTDEIAAAAGVAVGTLYNYFRHKESILDQILEGEHAWRAREFERIAAGDLHPLEKVRRVIEVHLERLRRDPARARVLLSEKWFWGQCHLEGPGRPGCFPAFVARVLEQGIEDGTLRAHSPRLVALTIYGALEAVVGRRIMELEAHLDSDWLEQVPAELTALLWSGLIHRD